MMEFTAMTLVLLASVARVTFAQTSSDELFLNACQLFTNASLYYEFEEDVIARHSIYEDPLGGQRRITCFINTYGKHVRQVKVNRIFFLVQLA